MGEEEGAVRRTTKDIMNMSAGAALWVGTDRVGLFRNIVETSINGVFGSNPVAIILLLIDQAVRLSLELEAADGYDGLL